MARPTLWVAVGIATLIVMSTAMGQQDSEPALLDIILDEQGPHMAGLIPQSLQVRVEANGEPVSGARLVFETPGAPDHAYCTCGQATADSDGRFEIQWGMLEADTLVLRITARADGFTDATGEFVLRTIEQNSESTGKEISLWIPSSMLEGQSYEGVVITTRTYPHGARVLLSSSDPESVKTDPEAVLHAGENHAIFAIHPKAATQSVEIFASIDGPLVGAETRIHSQQSAPSKLRLVFPSSKTLSDSTTTYIFVTDQNGAPARVETDTKVALETGHALETLEEVKILAGKFYTSFSTKVFGDGTLWAHSEGLESASAPIEKALSGVTLYMGIAPDPAGANSRAKYYAWLLADGLPYSSPRVHVGHIHTNNTSVAGFETSGADSSESAALYMRNGIVNGTLYTRSAGAVSITASFPDVGTATSSIVVGPTLLRGEERLSVPACIKTRDMATNSIGVWVHPDVTARHALLNVAPYHQRIANDECIDGQALSCEQGTKSECGVIVHPMETDNRQVSVSVSPPGVLYEKIVELTQHALRSFFVESSLVIQDVGNYMLEATSTNVLPSSDSFASPRNSTQYKLNITPLLVDAEGPAQDVALVSIVDSEGALVNALNTFGRPTKVVVTGQGITDTTLTITGSSASLYADLDSASTITVTAPNLVHDTVHIPIPRVASNIDIDIPKSVHLHEEFPFAIHATDSEGALVAHIPQIKLAASGITTDWESHRMKAQHSGTLTMSVLGEHGAHQKSVDVFANELGIQILESGATARVGAPFRIDVVAPKDTKLDVSASIPWQSADDGSSINVTSAVPGTFPVTITASRQGYAPESKTVHVTVEDYAIFGVRATGTDDASLQIPQVELELSTRDLEETTSNVSLPWKREYRNLASASVEFPESHGDGDGYVFSHVTVGDRTYEQRKVNVAVSGDTDVHAIYERSVAVGIKDDSNVLGVGDYAYGQEVELVAQTRAKLAFLVLEVFERWEDLPEDAVVDNETVRFAASDDVRLQAVYRDDYTGVLLLVLAAMGAVVAIKYRRQNLWGSLGWTFSKAHRFAMARLGMLWAQTIQRKKTSSKDLQTKR